MLWCKESQQQDLRVIVSVEIWLEVKFSVLQSPTWTNSLQEL